eukprot:419099_1
MLFTLIVSTLSCGLVFGAFPPAPTDLPGLPGSCGYAFLGDDAQDFKQSQSVRVKNGAVHKPGNNLGRIVMHLIIIVFISVFISVYCGAYYWTKKNKQAQVVNENSTSNV